MSIKYEKRKKYRGEIEKKTNLETILKKSKE